MRIFNFKLFEETIAVPNGTLSVEQITNPAFNGLLGAADQLAFFVTADQVVAAGGAGTFFLSLEESADNIGWLIKNALGPAD